MSGARKILVIDDELEIRKLFIEYLGKKGYDVSSAENGYEAIEKMSKDKYDLVFLDIKMSGMNGVETFKCLREKHIDVPVVIMTGFRAKAEELIDDLLKKQIHSVIFKPFHMKDVESLIEDIWKITFIAQSQERLVGVSGFFYCLSYLC